MQALVSGAGEPTGPRQHLHAGDVDWWSVHAHGRTPGLDERIRLWFAGEPDATELVGFAWYGPPNDADLIVAPAARGPAVIGAMVDWVASQVPRFGRSRQRDSAGSTSTSSRPRRRTTPGRRATDPLRRSSAAGLDGRGGRGERSGSGRAWTRSRAGARLRPLHRPARRARPGRAGPAGRVRPRDDRDRCGRRRAGRGRPRRLPGLDADRREVPLLPIDAALPAGARHDRAGPDGSVVAFALGWLDPLTGGVELEPVGVHPDHQRRGLGRAVCRAALRAARAMGGQEVVIAAERANPAAIGLYSSLGLAITASVVAWSRPVVSA